MIFLKTVRKIYKLRYTKYQNNELITRQLNTNNLKRENVMLFQRFQLLLYASLVMILICFEDSVAQTEIQSIKIPDPERFAAEIRIFRDWDNKNTFPEDAVLFVGSSSIRMWETKRFFDDYPVINRGFGGSHISDVVHFFDLVVSKYHPRAVVFYAGDNDIAFGKEVNRVVDDYKKFVTMVESECPDTPIIYVAIKPSLSRWRFWPQMRETNHKIAEFSNQKKDLHFLDISSIMLNQSGEPDSSLFIEDGLHLNEKGYELWTGLLKDTLDKIIPCCGIKKAQETIR